MQDLTIIVESGRIRGATPPRERAFWLEVQARDGSSTIVWVGDRLELALEAARAWTRAGARLVIAGGLA
jgi:hypothetical protein